MKIRFWPVLGVLLVVLAILITIRLSSFKLFEQDIIAQMQLSLTPNSIVFFQVVTKYISIISLGIPAIFLIRGLISKNKEFVRKGLFILLSIGIAGLIGFCLKRTIKEPRPYEVDQRITQYSSGGSNSFPSGHTAEATVAAVGFSFILFHGWLHAILAFGWAILIMYTRIILGVHNFTDILGGITVAVLGITIMRKVFDRIGWDYDKL